MKRALGQSFEFGFGVTFNSGSLRRAVPLILLAAISASSGAQAVGQATPLTIVDAVHEAVSWHPAVKRAIGQLNQGVEEIKAARAAYGPQLSVGLGSDFEDPAGASLRPRATVSASQLLYDFGKVSSKVDSAKAAEAVDRAQLIGTIDSLARDTSYAVIEVQRAVALRTAALDQLESVNAISDLVEQRYRHGAATKSDALQAKSRVQAAQGTIAQLTAQQERWRATLAHLLGRSDFGPVAETAPPWLDHACAIQNIDWTRVPAIMEASAQRDRVEADLEYAKAARLPTVSLGAGTSADIGAPFSNRSRYSFGINVSTDLYGSRVSRSQLRGAAFALEASDAALANTRNDVFAATEEAKRQVSSLRRVLDILRARAASMGETDKLYRLQYLQMGTRTLVDLLNAVQELHQSNFDMVNVAHDLRRLEIDCLFNTGQIRQAFDLGDLTAERKRS